jgi:hypothetical protein
VASEKSARFFVKSSASRARATSIGFTQTSSIPRARQRSSNGFPMPRRLAGDDEPGEARTLGERERPVEDLVDHPRRAGEHGLRERGRLVIGEHGRLLRRREVDAEDRTLGSDDGTKSRQARVAPRVSADGQPLNGLSGRWIQAQWWCSSAEGGSFVPLGAPPIIPSIWRPPVLKNRHTRAPASAKKTMLRIVV